MPWSPSFAGAGSSDRPARDCRPFRHQFGLGDTFSVVTAEYGAGMWDTELEIDPLSGFTATQRHLLKTKENTDLTLYLGSGHTIKGQLRRSMNWPEEICICTEVKYGSDVIAHIDTRTVIAMIL